MSANTRSTANPPPGRQAAAASGPQASPGGAGGARGPVLTAQRERIEAAFGPAVQLAAAEPNRTGLPDGLKAGVESLSGIDMSDVRVHTNSDRPGQLNALAYAQGSDIHVGPGQEKHLPHEAWHLVQQRQGRVAATTQVGGTPVNDDPGLEREADRMGAQAAQVGQRRADPAAATSPAPAVSTRVRQNATEQGATEQEGTGQEGTGQEATEQENTEQDADEGERKKQLAHQWLQAQLAAGVENEAALLGLLEQAKAEFGLSEVLLDTRNKSKPRIGLKASPTLWADYLPNKLIGNAASDWGLWGVYGGLSYVRDLFRSKPDSKSQTNVVWGPLTGRGFGSYMLADPLTKFGPPGSGPSVSNPTWQVLLKRRQKNSAGSASYYVLGHLLNDNVHGPGDDMKNLTPLSQRTNNHSPIGHLKAIENSVKSDVANNVLSYQVIPSYGRSPLKWPRYLYNAVNYISDIGDVLAAEDHVPEGLTAAYWKYDAKGRRVLAKKVWIPQLQVGSDLETNHYYIKTGLGPMIDVSEPSTIWGAIRGLFMGALAAGLALSAAQTLRLLRAYAGSQNLTVLDVVVAHQFSVSVVLGLLSAFRNRQLNPWPKDPTNK